MSYLPVKKKEKKETNLPVEKAIAPMKAGGSTRMMQPIPAEKERNWAVFESREESTRWK